MPLLLNSYGILTQCARTYSQLSDITHDFIRSLKQKLLGCVFHRPQGTFSNISSINSDSTGDITQSERQPIAPETAVSQRFCGQRGSSLIEVSLVLPILLLLFAGIVDLGRAIYYSEVLTTAAGASAVYGSQNPADITGMENLVNADAAQVPGVTATASYGCECQDGSSMTSECNPEPVCTNGTVYYVTVTASTHYTPMVHWPGVPASIPLAASSTMRGEE